MMFWIIYSMFSPIGRPYTPQASYSGTISISTLGNHPTSAHLVSASLWYAFVALVTFLQAIVNRVRMYYGKQVTPYFSGLFQTFKTGEGSGSADASSREDAPPPSQPVTGGR